MKLREVLIESEKLDEYEVVYAKRPWTLDSEASVIKCDGDQPVVRVLMSDPSFEYFLEAPLIKDIRQQVEKAGRTPKEALDVLLYYAENDAFPQ